MPGSWLTYTALNDLFTVSYPPSWSVLQERSNLVVLAGPNYVALNIGVVKARCDVSEGAAVEETYPCLALLVAEQEGGAYELQLVSIGKWSDGTHRGFALEYTEYNPEYDAYTYNVHVYLPLDDQTMVVALYLHVGTETLTDHEREDLATMIGSIRLPER